MASEAAAGDGVPRCVAVMAAESLLRSSSCQLSSPERPPGPRHSPTGLRLARGASLLGIGCPAPARRTQRTRPATRALGHTTRLVEAAGRHWTQRRSPRRRCRPAAPAAAASAAAGFGVPPHVQCTPQTLAPLLLQPQRQRTCPSGPSQHTPPTARTIPRQDGHRHRPATRPSGGALRPAGAAAAALPRVPRPHALEQLGHQGPPDGGCVRTWLRASPAPSTQLAQPHRACPPPLPPSPCVPSQAPTPPPWTTPRRTAS